MRTPSKAFGLWQEIFKQLLPSLTLDSRRHQPCPYCGGKDRFRLFADWQQKGCYICNQCGNGDGFDLIEKIAGTDFAGACREIDQLLISDIDRRPVLTQKPTGPSKKQVRLRYARYKELMRGSRPLAAHQEAREYIDRRGLSALIDRQDLPPGWRAIDQLDYWHNGQEIGAFPALIAWVNRPMGEHACLHRTYLPTDGQALPGSKRKLTQSAHINGWLTGHIGLYHIEGNVLAVAEGIETALAVRAATGLPVWSAVTAGGLERLKVPPTVREVFIMADNDASQAGELAATRLANRLNHEGLNVRVCIPPRIGMDWLDVYNEDPSAVTEVVL